MWSNLWSKDNPDETHCNKKKNDNPRMDYATNIASKPTNNAMDPTSMPANAIFLVAMISFSMSSVVLSLAILTLPLTFFWCQTFFDLWEMSSHEVEFIRLFLHAIPVLFQVLVDPIHF